MAKAQAWDWKPPASLNSIMKVWLRLPLLHRLVSRQLLLLMFTGRKSGKSYTIPVGYLRQGQTIIILTKRFRTWWRNFQDSLPVTVRVEGQDHRAQAQALTDTTVTIPIITEVMIQHPGDADFFGVRLPAPGQPDQDDIRRIAPEVIVLQIQLAD
ncbi:MAG TPA: nitroreductase/quinone reductase family protein [Phototrophicaceae bacterium]|nr:nitroreductase/quinone reductase family protein [Phototrophicaceae bacterium]